MMKRDSRMEIESTPKNPEFLYQWTSQAGTYFGSPSFSSSNLKNLFDNEIESRNSTIGTDLKKQNQSTSTAELVLQEELNTPEELVLSFPLVDTSDEKFKDLLINKYYAKETSAPQEVKLLQFYSEPDQYDPYLLRPRYNNSFSYIYDKNSNSENSMHPLINQDIGKAGEQKIDLAKQFLKIYMKKCMDYAINCVAPIRDILKTVLFEENAAIFPFSRDYRERFLTQKIFEFKKWLIGLRVKFRHYGKQDFREAYVANNIQSIIIMLDHINALASNSASITQLEEVNTLINENLMKEAFKRVSLSFIIDKGPYGLISELNQSINTGNSKDHLKYLEVTKWLLEKPSRIDTAEINRKTWIESVFKAVTK